MDTRQQNKPLRITAQDLEQAARLGVERALAARRGMTELTPEQTEQVSGGAKTLVVGVVIRPPIVGVIIKPPVMGFAPVPAPIDPLA